MSEVLTITQAGHLADLIRGVEQNKKLEHDDREAGALQEDAVVSYNLTRAIIGWLEVQDQPRTIAEIAAGVGCSRETVRRVIRQLEVAGALDVDRQWPNSYRLRRP
jgi:response regulator of citrate/malate metabolism